MAYLEAPARRQQMIDAARRAFARDGVARTSLRAVAAEAGVPLGTLQYAFPSKEQLLKAVIEDVVDEIAGVLRNTAELDRGLAHAIRHGLEEFWSALVEESTNLQVMQYELTMYALRTPGQEWLARWQYERYAGVVAAWCQEAAQHAGERCAVPFAQLGRIIVSTIDGLILQHVCDPNPSRSGEDLAAATRMVLALAEVAG